MKTEQMIIPILIDDVTNIYDTTIQEEKQNNTDFRELRFNLARLLLDLYWELGKIPYSQVMN